MDEDSLVFTVEEVAQLLLPKPAHAANYPVAYTWGRYLSTKDLGQAYGQGCRAGQSVPSTGTGYGYWILDFGDQALSGVTYGAAFPGNRMFVSIADVINISKS